MKVEQIAAEAKKAAQTLSFAATEQKNNALSKAAQALTQNTAAILAANQKDLENGRAAGLTAALLDRLTVTEQRVADMTAGLTELVHEADPVGEVVTGAKRPNGLLVQQVRVPMGVIGIIYEARPNVTVDAFGICLKAGNAVILRGGKEAIETNKVLAKILQNAVLAAGLPKGTVQLITNTTHESANELMRCNTLDLLIPRGGARLINAVVQNATVPVIQTGVGNCHAYVDASADLETAAKIVENGKCSRPSVCNALETLLVHRSIAEQALPAIAKRLAPHGVELRGCAETCRILSGVTPATEQDYATEFLDYILAVRVVNSFEEALAHIRRYSTGHSECIITKDYNNAERFVNELDSAVLYINASTRFTDGGQFGMGAEIGISTQKLHARGPMGLKELTSTKYIVRGAGQIRE